MGSFTRFDDLPREMRNRIYDEVAKLDFPIIASKPLPDKTYIVGKYLSHFSSEQTSREYRSVLVDDLFREHGQVSINIADFNFHCITQYLTKRKLDGNLFKFVDALGTPPLLQIDLRFTRSFNGDTDRVMRWVRFVKSLERGAPTFVSAAYEAKIVDITPTTRKYLTSFAVHEDAPEHMKCIDDAVRGGLSRHLQKMNDRRLEELDAHWAPQFAYQPPSPRSIKEEPEDE